jgi:uncharacterized protein YbjT (DUF2867 family)
MNMKILVTASTGNIGRRVLKELMAPEFSVRVITKSPERLPWEIREQIEVVQGSADHPATLRRALEDVEALFWCVPTESLRETNVRGHYERFARSGAFAIREARTPRVVTVSAGSKGLARHAGQLLGLHAMEDILNESGAAIRHLRCAPFMENFARQLNSICHHGIFSYPMPGHIPVSMVAASDIADSVLRWLVRQDWKGIEPVNVHGPENLSYNQAAAVIERILERPVRYAEASANQYAQWLVGSGASPEYARSQVEMFAELTQGVNRVEARTAASTTTITLAAWVESELLPQFESVRSRSGTELAASAPVCET